MKSTLLAAMMVLSGVLMAQDLPRPMPMPLLPPDQEIKAYLGLNDTQLQALRDVQKSKSDAEQAIYTELRAKNEALRQLLESGSLDAARIGQIMIDIQQLQKKLPISGEPYRTQALNALNAEQKAKLPTLSQALTLQSTGWQAVYFSLIDAPPRDIRILPVAMPAPLSDTATFSGNSVSSRLDH